ncbi:hypothetical protein GYB61_04550 [bacterium]|nr:hypothetical protein [bacterium]
MRVSLPVVALFVAALASACGFQLRGRQALPPALSQVFIQVQSEYGVLEPPIVAALRRSLRARGATVVRKAWQADSALVIEQLENTRRILSVGSDGKAIEYELTTTVRYALRDDKDNRIPPQQLSLTRDYLFNSEAVLATEAEERKLRDVMQAELAELMLLRLESTLAAQTPHPKSPGDFDLSPRER